MAAISLNNVRDVRRVLGLTQAGLGQLLGVSLRAVQSYEQGWRPVPTYIQQLCAMHLFLRTGEKRKKMPPCWIVRDCDLSLRNDCPAFLYDAGDLCWLVTGSQCRCQGTDSWDEKLKTCPQCEVLRAWLDAPEKP